MSYWIKRVRLNLAMLEQLDLIGRTGELARAFGIDFFSVLTRGSQYRVESLLVRMAHSQNYLMLSPDREQVLLCLGGSSQRKFLCRTFHCFHLTKIS